MPTKCKDHQVTPHWKGFAQQRRDAKKRGIGFNLSFDEWHSVWSASGKINLRGRRKGQFVMSRFGDKGAYKIGNVEIKTCSENIIEGTIKLIGIKRSEETKRKVSEANKGRIISATHKLALSRAHKGIPKGPMKEETKRKLSVAHMGLKAPIKSPKGRLSISKHKKEYWRQWRENKARGE